VVDFTNIFTSIFYAHSSQKSKISVNVSIFLSFWDLRVQKLLVERWWNWHLATSVAPNNLNLDYVNLNSNLNNVSHMNKDTKTLSVLQYLSSFIIIHNYCFLVSMFLYSRLSSNLSIEIDFD